jgi:hypothetical protein
MEKSMVMGNISIQMVINMKANSIKDRYKIVRENYCSSKVESILEILIKAKLRVMELCTMK